MSRCGICGRGEGDAVSYHPQCLEKVFRASEFPRFDYSLAELKDLLVEQARDRISLPGETPVLAFHCKVYRWRTPRSWELLQVVKLLQEAGVEVVHG